jgi:Polysaccharide lyase
MAIQPMSDDFEADGLDLRKWTARQAKPEQLRVTGEDAFKGARSLTVTVREGDGGSECNPNVPCQRAEVRLHGRWRPVYGEEFWHAFTFRMSGDIADEGSLRTVIGQWKAPGDDSPILAQRFDNGVFHITTQDGPTRKVIASAEGDFDRLEAFENAISEMAEDPALGFAAIRASDAAASLMRMSRHAAATALTPLTGQFRVGLEEVATRVRAAFGLSEMGRLLGEFSFISDLACYAGRPAIAVAPDGTKHLPDPTAEWVHMMYRMRAGRTDNLYGSTDPGLIEVYADSTLVAAVEGNIGARQTTAPTDPSMYFKFGIYRDVAPGVITFHFDHWRCGPTRASVEGDST